MNVPIEEKRKKKKENNAHPFSYTHTHIYVCKEYVHCAHTYIHYISHTQKTEYSVGNLLRSTIKKKKENLKILWNQVRKKIVENWQFFPIFYGVPFRRVLLFAVKTSRIHTTQNKMAAERQVNESKTCMQDGKTTNTPFNQYSSNERVQAANERAFLLSVFFFPSLSSHC